MRINSVVGGGKTVKLSELAFVDGVTQLGKGTAIPMLQPTSNDPDASAQLNDGKISASSGVECALPCTVLYRFSSPVSPTAVRLAGSGSPQFPAAISVLYSTTMANASLVDLSTGQPSKSICNYPGTSAALANDGNTARNHPVEWHACLSKPLPKNPWWGVQLKSPTTNPTVTIYTRDCCNKNMIGLGVKIYLVDSFELPQNFLQTAAFRTPCLTLGAFPDRATLSGVCKGRGSSLFIVSSSRYLMLPEVVVSGKVSPCTADAGSSIMS